MLNLSIAMDRTARGGFVAVCLRLLRSLVPPGGCCLHSPCVCLPSCVLTGGCHDHGPVCDLTLASIHVVEAVQGCKG